MALFAKLLSNESRTCNKVRTDISLVFIEHQRFDRVLVQNIAGLLAMTIKRFRPCIAPNEVLPRFCRGYH